MAGPLAPATLEPVIAEARGLVEEALQALSDPRSDPINLDGIAAAARFVGMTTAEMLAATLDQRHWSEGFVAFLAAHARPLDGAAFAATVARLMRDSVSAAGDLVDIRFDEAELAAFALRSKSFRCRIRVGAKVVGSGALVSPRLVITAQHVLAAAEAAPGQIRVVGPDGKSHAATVAFASPPHADELTGGLPPADAAATHCDVALLRLDQPLGRRFAQVDLPLAPVPAAGKSPFVLVHFPGGEATGISFGEIDRSSATALRYPHSARTAGGSSGGPGFDSRFRFLGLHQGPLRKVKRIIPFEQFCTHADFRARIDGDRQMRYLWSLDGSPEGHLVIGRQLFCEALAAMTAGEVPSLRGIAVRRKKLDDPTGLGFSHDLLMAWLDGAAHRVLRVPTGLEVADLVGRLHTEAFASSAAPAAAPAAAPGVRADETTLVAHDADRARALAAALEAQAQAEGRMLWIFFENPPSGLLQETQVQFEHLVDELMARPSVRVVLAGFETYKIAETLYETLGEARNSPRPGLLAEYVGTFTSADVRFTADEMARTMGYNWAAEVLDRIVRLALAGLGVAGGVYGAAALPAVAAKLRDEARREEGRA